MEQTAPKYLDDMELAQRAADGDRAARILLAERLFDKIRTNCWYLAGMDRDFDDLVQLSLLEVLKSVHTYSGRSKLETWAERITVRTALRYLKRRRGKESVVMHGVEHDGFCHEESEKRAGEGQLKVIVHRLMWQLKPERRTVVILKLIQRYSIKEIAEITQTPVNTVRDRLRIGKEKLRRLMRNEPALADWIGDHSHD